MKWLVLHTARTSELCPLFRPRQLPVAAAIPQMLVAVATIQTHLEDQAAITKTSNRI